MNNKNSPQKDNNLLFSLLCLAGGATIVYWLMKDKLKQKDQELSQINQINQTKEQQKEQELKKTQNEVQELKQQIVKLNEKPKQKNNYFNQGFDFLINLFSWFILGKWLWKKITV